MLSPAVRRGRKECSGFLQEGQGHLVGQGDCLGQTFYFLLGSRGFLFAGAGLKGWGSVIYGHCEVRTTVSLSKALFPGQLMCGNLVSFKTLKLGPPFYLPTVSWWFGPLKGFSAGVWGLHGKHTPRCLFLWAVFY